MFTTEDFRARRNAEPFVPFRVVTARGATYDITHPDLLMAGRRWIMVGRPTVEDPTLADQVFRVPFEEIVEVRDLPTTA